MEGGGACLRVLRGHEGKIWAVDADREGVEMRGRDITANTSCSNLWLTFSGNGNPFPWQKKPFSENNRLESKQGLHPNEPQYGAITKSDPREHLAM